MIVRWKMVWVLPIVAYCHHAAVGSVKLLLRRSNSSY